MHIILTLLFLLSLIHVFQFNIIHNTDNIYNTCGS